MAIMANITGRMNLRKAANLRGFFTFLVYCFTYVGLARETNKPAKLSRNRISSTDLKKK